MHFVSIRIDTDDNRIVDEDNSYDYTAFIVRGSVGAVEKIHREIAQKFDDCRISVLHRRQHDTLMWSRWGYPIDEIFQSIWCCALGHCQENQENAATLMTLGSFLTDYPRTLCREVLQDHFGCDVVF